jgi:glycosyltransferase involved in cell wall biosynthesis
MRSWNYVRALEDRCELSLIHPSRQGAEPEARYVSQARQSLSEIWSVPIPPRTERQPDTLAQRVARKFSMIPWEIDSSYQPAFAEAVNRVIADHRFDVILARHIYQAQYLFHLVNRIESRVIVDIDDIETRRIGRQQGLDSHGPLNRWRAQINNAVLGAYHRRRLPAVDTCLVCSEEDRRYVLARKWTSRVAVVPNAIDVDGYEVGEGRREPKTLLFCGTLDYEPNADAIVWFAREALPALKRMHADVKVVVVGHNPPAEVRALAADPSIVLHADVPDVTPFYEQASAIIVPIRIAGGTRVKILEAGACRRPVVSTSIGAEGLDLVPGRHYLMAEHPIEFAARCSELFTNQELSRRLVDELYRFVTSRYDTRVVVEQIRRVFDGDDRTVTAATGH